MSEREVFVLADERLNAVVAQISDEQWAVKVPEWFPRRRTEVTPTLREIVTYHAYDDSWVPDMLAGRTMEEAGREKFKGDLLGEDPKGAFGAIVRRACAAVRELEDLDEVVHTSFGDFPAREYLWQTTYFRGSRSFDIARVIGVDSTLPDDLVEGMWDELSPMAEEWRAMGVFPPAVPIPTGAPLHDRLLGLMGRDPKAPT
jgi:uncharacterized protein (TIGR03086 family)